MMKKSLLALTGSLLIVGCGSEAPSIDDVRADLDNPTASIGEKSAVTAAAQRQSGSESTVDVGGANPFGGLGLTAANSPRQGLNPMVPLEPFFQHVEHRFGRSLRLKQGLRASQLEGGFFTCFNDSFAQSNISSSDSSFSASIEVDFDRCSVEGASGKLKLEMNGKVDIQAGTFEMTATYEYDALCITTLGQQVCQTGAMELEADGTVTGVSVAMTTLAGWKFDTTITRDGKARSFTNKGGLEMTLGASNSMATGSFRMVVYLTNDRGEELTFTLTIKFSESGGKFTITGKDGTLTCSLTEERGSCSGDGTIEWNEDDWSSAFDLYGGL